VTLVGIHAVEEHLRQAEDESGNADQLRRAELLIVEEGQRRTPIVAHARELGVKIRRVTARQLAEIIRRETETETGGRTDGLVLRLPEAQTGGSLRQRLQQLDDDAEVFVIALDGVTDPVNVGSILRTADQFGASFVLLPRRRTAGVTSTVHRVSAGAAAYVETLEVPNLAQALTDLRDAGIWIYGAEASGEDLTQVELARRTALVLGSEGTGLHRLTRERCDRLVKIPTVGRVDSLNVGVAAGVLMYEFRRQRAAGQVS
jgi:23S rRNA (guanosine2251-2'-O)-methyltransferase